MSVWPGAERRRRRPRRASNPVAVVGVIGVVGASILLAAVIVVDRLAERVVARAEPASTSASESPVVNARRVPLTLSVATRIGRVERSLDAAVASMPSGSCATVDWEGERLAAVDPTEPLVPASAMKVITGAVALEVLGADHTYETAVHGVIDSGGTAQTLWLVGGGDPLLVTAGYPSTEKYPTFNQTSLEGLADQLVAAGLRSVSGVVAGVDTRYDAERFVSSWPASFQFVEGGPLGALMVDDGVVLGQAVKPADPALAAAQVFVSLLSERGVVVAGGASRDVLPAGVAKIASVASSPLSSQVQTILVNSDNNASELLLKEIGLKVSATPTTAGGAAAVLGVLESWGLAGGVTVADGSGLSRDNRVPCAIFASLLERLADRLPGLLPVAGESGTLRSIFDGESVEGRLVGKTGTLSGVKSLVGYVPVENGSPVRFTMVMNSSGIDNQSRYRPVWYAVASAMARASAVPGADQLAP